MARCCNVGAAESSAAHPTSREPSLTQPRVLIDPSRSSQADLPQPDASTAWRWVGLFSVVLTAAGILDWVLTWTPLRFGSPEWEFGTIVSSIAGLPLITMGFAGLLGSAMARGIRWQIQTVAAGMTLFGVAVVGALVIFALDVPVALRVVEGPARLGIVKAIIKTGALGVLFALAYFVAAAGAVRHARRSASRPT